MQMIDAETVHRLLPYEALIPALKKMPAGDLLLTADPTKAGNMFATLPGWLGGRLIVVKMVGVFPGNRKRNPPIGSVLGAAPPFRPRAA